MHTSTVQMQDQFLTSSCMVYFSWTRAVKCMIVHLYKTQFICFGTLDYLYGLKVIGKIQIDMGHKLGQIFHWTICWLFGPSHLV